MSLTFNFLLTQAGQNTLWNSSNSGLGLNLTHVQLGSGNRTPDGSETALVQPQQLAPIAAGFRVSDKQIRMSAIFGGSSSYAIREIGLWAGDPAAPGSKLFAYWSKSSGDLTFKSANVDFIFSHDMTLDGAAPSILADNAQSPLLAMIAAHEAKPDPHPQYLRKNLLINGDFSVWQRGSNFTISGAHAYTADRWIVSPGATNTLGVSKQTHVLGDPLLNVNHESYIRIVPIGNLPGSLQNFQQRIGDVRILAGKTVTLSFYARAGDATTTLPNIVLVQDFGSGSLASPAVTTVVTNNLTLSNAWRRYSYTVNLPALTGKTLDSNSISKPLLQLVFTLPTVLTSFLDFSAIQLEASPQATDFEYRHPAETLALCQHYYEKSYDVNTAPGTADNFIGASALISGQPRSQISYKVKKRVAPTVIFYAPKTGESGKATNSTTNNSLATLAAAESGENSFSTSYNLSGAITPPAGQDVRFHWVANAEL